MRRGILHMPGRRGLRRFAPGAETFRRASTVPAGHIRDGGHMAHRGQPVKRDHAFDIFAAKGF